MLYNAVLYDKLKNNIVQCNLCSQVRENYKGKLYTLVYGNLISATPDPIEKKPLYHFLPGSKAYSIATPGCNFNCEWCQNWQISQMFRTMEIPEFKKRAPEDVINHAIQTGCKSIAYTYTEPTVFFEYAFDVSKLAARNGLMNIFVTNGFMTPEMLKMYHPLMDAANVDIKAFKEETYKKLIGGHLEPVLESCKLMKSMGIWLEITTLIVPDVNDDPKELEAIAKFIFNDLGPETPWHISRFFPRYQMKDRPATEESILFEAKVIGEAAGLHYVYIGNIYGTSDTKCKNCGQKLITRQDYVTRIVGLNEYGKCDNCGTALDGAWLTTQL
jgi:pyruvate formate lyase activating enzyme